MPKVKIAHKSTLVDMTPMCDVAFLLLLFFMLTSKFKPQEAVKVITPTSISTTLLPESHVAMITISKDGRVFFGIDDQNQRLQLIKNISDQYKLALDGQEMKNYALASNVGMPINKLKQFLDMTPDQQRAYHQDGIPVDSATQELSQWVDYTVNINNNNPKLQFVVKADDGTKFSVIHKVLEIMKQNNHNKLDLITSLKAVPEGTPAYEKYKKAGDTPGNAAEE
ncbi:MAG: biopolymer transporter ExbD [Chitinophagaceae bacterium]|nr:MAG: biopolymer transporter ExbD [Chitinophagaceae bacterium]